jgi:ABC-type amino acid transport substrate-binding protein
MIRLKILLPLICLALIAVLCASCSSSYFSDNRKSAASVSYSDQALHNYKQGQYYASAGRFELAREYYLLALAAADDPDLQDIINRELHAADAAIHIQR